MVQSRLGIARISSNLSARRPLRRNGTRTKDLSRSQISILLWMEAACRFPRLLEQRIQQCHRLRLAVPASRLHKVPSISRPRQVLPISHPHQVRPIFHLHLVLRTLRLLHTLHLQRLPLLQLLRHLQPHIFRLRPGLTSHRLPLLATYLPRPTKPMILVPIIHHPRRLIMITTTRRHTDIRSPSRTNMLRVTKVGEDRRRRRANTHLHLRLISKRHHLNQLLRVPMILMHISILHIIILQGTTIRLRLRHKPNISIITMLRTTLDNIHPLHLRLPNTRTNTSTTIRHPNTENRGAPQQVQVSGVEVLLMPVQVAVVALQSIRHRPAQQGSTVGQQNIPPRRRRLQKGRSN